MITRLIITSFLQGFLSTEESQYCMSYIVVQTKACGLWSLAKYVICLLVVFMARCQVSYQNKNPAYFVSIKRFSACHCLTVEKHQWSGHMRLCQCVKVWLKLLVKPSHYYILEVYSCKFYGMHVLSWNIFFRREIIFYPTACVLLWLHIGNGKIVLVTMKRIM